MISSVEGHHEVYALYQTVLSGEGEDPFTCQHGKKGRKQLFIKSDCSEDTLMLASEKAQTAFLKYIEQAFCEDDMDIDSWYGWKCNMDNPKA